MEKEEIDEYDNEFMRLLAEIEKRLEEFKKHEQIRINSWCKKLCLIINNIEWKKNRNLHAICLLDCILNKKFEYPYNKLAPEGAVPIISKTIVKSKLSKKFIENSIELEQQKEKSERKKVTEFAQKQNDYLIGNKNYSVNMNKENRNIKVVMKENDSINSSSNNNSLKNKLEMVQKENEQKDKMIQKLKEENMKLEKRVQELEKMLSSFLALEQK